MKKRILLITAAALLASSALAATQLTSVLTWLAPTTNTDGTAISGTLTYNIYASYSGGAYVSAASGVSALTYSDASPSLVDGSTACYEVSAVEGGVESAKSAAVCKTFPAAVPSAPAGLVVK